MWQKMLYFIFQSLIDLILLSFDFMRVGLSCFGLLRKLVKYKKIIFYLFILISVMLSYHT